MKTSHRRYQTPAEPPKLISRSATTGAPSLSGDSAGQPRRGSAVRALLRWPFTSRLASPIWLGVRLYLGVFWLQMGMAKIQGGWLTTNPMDGMFRAIANGYTPAPFGFYRGVVQLLLDLGMAPVISVTFPFLELAIGLAFISGVLVVPAAIGAILMNTNLLLSGIASLSLDGRFIVLQLLLILAWRVSSYLGIQRPLLRGLKAALRAVRPQRVTTPATLQGAC